MILQALLLAFLGVACTNALPTINVGERSVSPKLNLSSYAPVRIQCPSRSQWVRPAQGLSSEEASWVAGRKKKVVSGLDAYLRRLHLSDFNVDGYIQKLNSSPSSVPTIGVAISGGGWASALTGTALLRGLDARFEPARHQRTGGILQSMTYLSGLSGGSWPVIGLATYNFPTIDDMVSHWDVDQSPLFAKNNTANRVTPETLFEQIVPKYKAGFNLSISEMLGRGFAYEFAAGENGAMETMVSDIASLSNFENYEMPFPMWQGFLGKPSDPELYGLMYPGNNSDIVEWNPFEFGAWEGPAAFFPLQYLGTRLSNGQPINNTCIVGFDRVSFMLGAAADALNLWQIEAWSNGTLGEFSKREVKAKNARRSQPFFNTTSFPQYVLSALEAPFKKYFNYTYSEMMYSSVPNPFASSPELLTIIDESEETFGQSLPLWSQIQPARNPDFIIAWDNDQDAHPLNWSNGTNIYNTYLYATAQNIPFPVIPPPATFVNNQDSMLAKPVLFGCDANLTNTKDTRSPIVAYMINAPYSAYTNYTWTNSQFTNEQMAVIMTNGFNYITSGNRTIDSEWPECLGCAAIDRSVEKLGMERTEQCQKCMAKYCWNGVEDNTNRGKVVDLPLLLDPGFSYAVWNKSQPFWPEVPARTCH